MKPEVYSNKLGKRSGSSSYRANRYTAKVVLACLRSMVKTVGLGVTLKGVLMENQVYQSKEIQ